MAQADGPFGICGGMILRESTNGKDPTAVTPSLRRVPRNGGAR